MVDEERRGEGASEKKRGEKKGKYNSKKMSIVTLK